MDNGNLVKYGTIGELFIHKDDGVEQLLLTLLANDYQVLFDNDGHETGKYWIKFAHREYDDYQFIALFDDEYVEKWEMEVRQEPEED